MAGAPVQSWVGDTGGAAATTFTVTLGTDATANNLLVASVSSQGSPTVSPETFSATGWLPLEVYDLSKASTHADGATFYRIATGDSNDNFTPVFSSSVRLVGVVVEYSGLDSISPYETSGEDVTYCQTEQADGTAINSGSATPSTAAGMAVAAHMGPIEFDASTSELDIDSSYTRDVFSARTGNNPIASLAHKVYTTTTAQSPNWTSSKGTNWRGYGAIATFKEASGGTVDDLLGDDVESTSEVTTPNFAQTHGLLADDTQSLSELTVPALTQIHDLLADSVESSSEISIPTLAEIYNLTADDVESVSEITTPTLIQIHNLLADDTQSLSELTVPALTQIHALASDSVESLSELSVPVLSQVGGDDLLADNVESLSELSIPTLSQIHALASDSVESASEISVPTITQVHNLLADDVESSSEVSTPVLTELAPGVDNLFADDVQSNSEVTSPVLSQTHVLFSASLDSGSEVSVPVFGQIHLISADSVESSSEVSTPVLTELVGATALFADSVESASEVSTSSLNQIFNLTAVNVESTSELSFPVFGQIHNLLADDVESTSELSTPVLFSGDITLTPGDITAIAEAVYAKFVTENYTDDIAAKVVIAGNLGYIEHTVFIDTELFPVIGEGTELEPFGITSDAITFAESKGFRKLALKSELIIDRQIRNFYIYGMGGVPKVDTNGHILTDSTFYQVDLHGNYSGRITVRDCYISTVNTVYTTVNGVFKNCGFGSVFEVPDGGVASIVSSYALVGQGFIKPSFSLGGIAGTGILELIDFTGGVTITNCNQPTDEARIIATGIVELEDSCIDGNIVILGNVKPIDNSGPGCNVQWINVNPDEVREIWDASYNKRERDPNTNIVDLSNRDKTAIQQQWQSNADYSLMDPIV